jgi:hypothetical protein
MATLSGQVTFTPEEIAAFPQGPPGPSGPAGGGSSGVRAVISAPSFPADAKPAIQAGLDMANPDRGGDVILTQGRYRLSSGLLSQRQGLTFRGEGMPGLDSATCRGSTQLVAVDGIQALTLGNPNAHQTRGYWLSGLHVMCDGPLRTGIGVYFQLAENCIIDDLSVSDYKNGTGIAVSGGTSPSGNAQYFTVRNLRVAACLTGLRLIGVAAHGLQLLGGYFSGDPTSSTRFGTGVLSEGADTLNVDGTRFQGWETCINIRKNPGHMIRARFENFGTAVRIGGEARGVTITGSFTRGDVGVYVEAGARNILFQPAYVAPDVNQPFVVEDSHASVRMEY